MTIAQQVEVEGKQFRIAPLTVPALFSLLEGDPWRPDFGYEVIVASLNAAPQSEPYTVHRLKAELPPLAAVELLMKTLQTNGITGARMARLIEGFNRRSVLQQ